MALVFSTAFLRAGRYCFAGEAVYYLIGRGTNTFGRVS